MILYYDTMQVVLQYVTGKRESVGLERRNAIGVGTEKMNRILIIRESNTQRSRSIASMLSMGPGIISNIVYASVF